MTTLSYKIEGAGSPLLLVHGLGVTYTIWKDLAPLLAPHFQLIMVELPGFGRSPLPDETQPYFETCADAIEELRLRLHIDPWDLLCYSLGTRVGEAYLRKYPSSVGRTIFLCPIRTDLAQALTLRALAHIDQSWPASGDWMLSGWRLYGLILALGFNGKKHPYAADWLREMSAQPVWSLKRPLFGLRYVAQKPFDLPEKPVLFIWGKRDIIATRPIRVRNGRQILVPGCHNAPMLAAPHVAEAVIRFLAIERPTRPVLKSRIGAS
jgi:pimeloyl-ACP methyl ester carboxylesterase